VSTEGVLSNIHCVGTAFADLYEPVGARRAAGSTATPRTETPASAAPLRKLRRLRSARLSFDGRARTCQMTNGTTQMAAPIWKSMAVR